MITELTIIISDLSSNLFNMSNNDNSQCDVLDTTSLGFRRTILRDDKYSRASRLQFTNVKKADELVNELSPNDNFLRLSSGKFTNGLNDIHDVS